MKLFKNIMIAGMSALLLLAGTSCDDFLDKAPENSVPESSVDYTDMNNLYMPVSGVYAALRTGGMHWVIWPLTIVRDGDVWSGRVDDQGILVDFGNLKYDNSFWGLNEMWNQYYGMIKIANGALDALDNYNENITSETDRANYRAYCGEVRILRAYAYYRLVQAFGPVTILRSNGQGDLTRSTVDAVQRYMLEDLQYAIDNCPKIRPNESAHVGAVTAYTAMALAAKVYMNRGEYAQAEALTDQIINSQKFSLYPDFYNLFKIPGKLCNESLMECQCTDFGIGSGDMVDADQWFVFQGPGNLGGWNFVGITDNFINWATARGETVRLETSVLVGGTTTRDGDFINLQGNTNNTNTWNGKAYTPTNQLTEGRTKYGSNNNIRVLRYADVLLMNAEAKVRQGKNGDAPFNLVRARAAMPSISNVTVDQVLDERRMELVCEWGERYNDLVRSGKASNVLPGWTEAVRYYPLPLAQLQNEPDLAKEPKAE
ncbi:MAG: RagB/SusD family nutrient uptake outer membrane protein [Muribaculaceae bacterium]|nr:RagB/SusD family nutrient uptake outer membrane protein [Muribaculaceae bacterium]